ncbi:hypothetical protein BDV32DRAFT_131692 [Aspergillus pseudonomiae]|nr:hypothetical protein BDV32DRAFT_131692 [Aspergillus pseudonomiae]
MIHLYFRQNNNSLQILRRRGERKTKRKILICSWIAVVILTTVGDSRYYFRGSGSSVPPT